MPRCRSCGSDAYRKLSLIHEGGLSLTESTTAGVGLAGGGLGIGAARTSGTSRTALSTRAAPPARKRVHPGFYVPLVIGILCVLPMSPALMFQGGCFMAIYFWALYRVTKYNREQYPTIYRQWDSSYMCERCGAVAVLDPGGNHLEPTTFSPIAQKRRTLLGHPVGLGAVAVLLLLVIIGLVADQSALTDRADEVMLAQASRPTAPAATRSVPALTGADACRQWESLGNKAAEYSQRCRYTMGASGRGSYSLTFGGDYGGDMLLAAVVLVRQLEVFDRQVKAPSSSIRLSFPDHEARGEGRPFSVTLAAIRTCPDADTPDARLCIVQRFTEGMKAAAR